MAVKLKRDAHAVVLPHKGYPRCVKPRYENNNTKTTSLKKDKATNFELCPSSIFCDKDLVFLCPVTNVNLEPFSQALPF